MGGLKELGYVMAEYRAAIAMREHMLDGHPVTLLEAILLFGVQGPNAEFGRMKKDGYLIKSQSIPMATVIHRLNTYTEVKVPKNLPYKEVQLTQYWVET